MEEKATCIGYIITQAAMLAGATWLTWAWHPTDNRILLAVLWLGLATAGGAIGLALGSLTIPLIARLADRHR